MLASLPWELLILGSVVLGTLGHGLAKYQVGKASSFQVLIYKYIASVIIITTIWFFSGSKWPRVWPFIYLYGALGGVSVAAYTAAFRHSLSKTVLTNPIKLLFSIVWAGIFLKEFFLFDIREPQGRLIVLGVILTGLFFWLFYEKKDEVLRWNKLVWFNVLYGSLLPVIVKFFLSQATPVELLTFGYWGSLSTAVLFTILRSHKLYIGKKFALVGLIHGVFSSSGVLLWFMALSLATVTQVALLRVPLFVLLATAVGLFVFHEKTKLTRRKIGGMAVAVLLLIVVLSI